MSAVFSGRPSSNQTGLFELVDGVGHVFGSFTDESILNGTLSFLSGRGMPHRPSEREKVEAAAAEERRRARMERSRGHGAG